jgi:enterochelin esterase-like enzyme
MITKEPLISPRVAALQCELVTGNVAALDSFWQQVSEEGAPLAEPIEGDDTHVLVTFLWRATEAITNVVVVFGLAGMDYPRNQMTRLLDTDLWYKTYRARSDARFTYLISPNDSLIALADAEDRQARIATWQPDPLNPHIYEAPFPRMSVVELADAPSQPWITPQANIPAGQVECHHLRSEVLRNERDVWVYRPPGYSTHGQPYSLVILLDAGGYPLIPVPTILNNMLAAQLLPPLVAVLLDNPDEGSRDRELACYSPFVDFLVQEFLPWARQGCHLTTEPSRTLIGGFSLGGLAATFAGLCRPDVFGNVLSQSAWFAWKPGEPLLDQEDVEHEWLAQQFVERPRLPLRFYIEVGLLEANPSLHNGPSSLVANRHMRNVLRAKGYPVHYAEFHGGHDCLCWRGTLADGLVALLGDSGRGGT